jgi:FSR family fosmidomycin resistance protein-like MFS transporter
LDYRRLALHSSRRLEKLLLSQATRLLGERGASDARLIASISAAHFVSHYYTLVLPPLFGFVRADYGVSYTELGLALVAFNVVSALLQTPAGFLVDRLGARTLLIGGLALGALAFAIAGLVDSFWVLVAMFALAGVGNTVYHPADYAFLSRHIRPERAAKAFSIHTFAGMLGWAVAPGTLLLMQASWGWRGAFLGASVLGLAAVVALLVQPEPPATIAAAKPSGEAAPSAWRLLMSGPIVLNLVFFMLLALVNGGLQNYSVVALGALYGTPPAIANAALSGYLALAAIGVLIGGYLATHTARHGRVAVIGLIAIAVLAALIAGVHFSDALLIAMMSASGFFNGAIMPSRDMIVREVTPQGSFGKVFGFVTTGFNIGGMISPLIFGLAMDHGRAQWVFLLVAAFSLMTILTLASGRKRANSSR